MLPIVQAAILERLKSLNATTSHFPLLGILVLLQRLVARFGVSRRDGNSLNMDAATALAVCAPALTNRKAAVRQAALELFATVYGAAMAIMDSKQEQVRLRLNCSLLAISMTSLFLVLVAFFIDHSQGI